ncbi:MAG: cobyrinate a,c-diamide synthase [Clostridiaceae bacterium]|jgi:cobyrinic acid a,c-diamide synthase|nr:cobyrinate a,c-diamide synthase [Clostridiaceae bacterium]
MTAEIPRLALAAPASGAGKTTLTCALLRAFQQKGVKPAAFKCGPDYIDPMFHRQITGAKSGNIDLFFASEDLARGLFCRQAAGCGLALIEGAMGYYDGVASSDQASAWQAARALAAPAVLIAQPRGAALTLAAALKGLLEFRPDSRIQAALLNRCSEGTYRRMKLLLERELGVPVMGYLPELPECRIESRHLGLVTAQETEDLRRKIQLLADQAARTVDLEGLLELAQSAPPLRGDLPAVAPVACRKPVIALAQDRAFCFYYPENLALLEELGAEIRPFSPLEDGELPADADALYLGGGYPELYGETLAQNRTMAESVRRAVESGLPTLAECGGFLYLHQAIEDREGRRWPAAGVFPGLCRPTGGLRRFGYVELTAKRDNLLCPAGETVRGHEFHYWESDDCGGDFRAEKPLSSRGWDCVHAGQTLYAGFPHLYFYSNPAFAARFVQAAADWNRKRQEDKETKRGERT